MDWDKLRIFHAAAEAGSFTHAADKLRMSQSAISRQVSNLEKELGIPLFHRHARGLVLTEQGELLNRTAIDVLHKLSHVELLLNETKNRPQGELRVTAPLGLGSVWLSEQLRDFFELYPDIGIQLILTDDQIDIAMREADVAIWASEPTQAELIRRPLFTMHTHGFASTSYVRQNGTPKTLADLDEHRLVSHSGNPPTHLQGINSLETLGREGQEPREPTFRANSVVAIKYAINAGIGIGIVPDYLAAEEQNLVRVLPQIELPTMPIYFVYAEEMRASKRLEVFRDFLIAKAKTWSF